MPENTPVPAARVEVRALARSRTLITTPTGTSFTLEADPALVLRMIDAWHTGRPSPALPPGWEDAALPLRELLEREGVFAGPAGPAADAGPDAHAGLDADTAPDADTDPATDAVPNTDAVLDADADPHADPAPGDLLLTGDPATVAALRRRIPRDAGPAARSMPSDDRQRVVHRAFRTGELLVWVMHDTDEATLVALDRLCSDARVPWVALEVSRSTVWLGPFVTPGTGASYEDLADRRTAAAFDPEAHRALRLPSIGGDAGLHPERLGAALDTALALLRGERPGDTLWEIRADGTALTHPVLPMPSSVIASARPHTPADLVDPLTGLVQRTRDVTHHPSIPPRLATAQSDVCNMRRVSRWANNSSCQGSAFDDRQQARASAVGEAVERYCGNLLDTLPVTLARYRDLRRGRMRALDPERLVLYSEAQYDAPGFPFARMTRDLELHWVPGRSLTTGEEILVPASMVYVNWFTAGYSGAPVTNFAPFAGIAAGPNREHAITSALEEIIERHTTMVWWLNGQRIEGTDPAELAEIWEGIPAEAGQRPSLIMLDNEFGVPVAAGVLHNDADTLLNVGFACRDTPRAAALKAWTEACTLQEGSRDLLPEDGAHWGAMRRGELNGRSFKPWRADRRYLDSFRPDMRDCDDLMVQQQVFLDPRAVARVAPLLEVPATRALEDTPSLPARSSDEYRRALERAGHEVIIVDITSPDIASTGMAVVRAIVPGTVGNAPAAFPFLGDDRVRDLAVELGWRREALPENEINLFPLPHA